MHEGMGFFGAVMSTAVSGGVGMFATVLRGIIWPYSLFLLWNGTYHSFWEFLFPAFWNAPHLIQH